MPLLPEQSSHLTVSLCYLFLCVKDEIPLLIFIIVFKTFYWALLVTGRRHTVVCGGVEL